MAFLLSHRHSHKEGIVLNITYNDKGTVRPIFYRLSLAEMVVLEMCRAVSCVPAGRSTRFPLLYLRRK